MSVSGLVHTRQATSDEQSPRHCVRGDDALTCALRTSRQSETHLTFKQRCSTHWPAKACTILSWCKLGLWPFFTPGASLHKTSGALSLAKRPSLQSKSPIVRTTQASLGMRLLPCIHSTGRIQFISNQHDGGGRARRVTSTCADTPRRSVLTCAGTQRMTPPV